MAEGKGLTIVPYKASSGETYDPKKLWGFKSSGEMLGYYQWGKTRGETAIQEERGEFWDNGKGVPLGDGPFSHTGERTSAEIAWENRKPKPDAHIDDQHDERR